MNKRPKSNCIDFSSDNSSLQQENSFRSQSNKNEKCFENQRNVKDAFNFFNNRHDQIGINHESLRQVDDAIEMEQPKIITQQENIDEESFPSPVKLKSIDKNEDRFIIKVVHGGFCRIFTYRRLNGFEYFRSQLYTQGKQSYKGPCSWFDHHNDRISLIDENDLNSMLDFLELYGERYVKVFLNNPSNNNLQ